MRLIICNHSYVLKICITHYDNPNELNSKQKINSAFVLIKNMHHLNAISLN